MPLDHAGTAFGMLCYSGALFYIGLSLAIEPASFVTSLHMFASGLRALEYRFRGLHWQERFRAPDVPHISPRMRNVVRLAGLAVIVCAFLPWLFALR